MLDTIRIWTDGACKPNPGSGGWAVVVLDRMKETILSGGEDSTTNNRMEYLAVLKAFEHIGDTDRKIVVYSDSKLLVDTFSNWVYKWERFGWKRKKKSNHDIKNLDLVKAVHLHNRKNIEYVWIRGHSGNKYNNACDRLANEEAQRVFEMV